MKPPKFLICENQSAQPGRLFLLHTQKPRFLGEIVLFDSLRTLEKWQLNPPAETFCTIEGQKAFVGTRTEIRGRIVAMYVIEFFDEPGDEIPAHGQIMRGGLMARAGDWLKSYFLKNNLKNLSL